MFDVKATKLILSPNHYWLSTLWIYANETTFFPSKLQRVPTQSSYSSCRPISPRCSISGMKMFFGQFFSKARCRVASSEEEHPSSSEESLGNPSGSLSTDQPSSSFFTNFMWQPRIKIKNTLNHSTVLIACFLACSGQLNPQTLLLCFSFPFHSHIVSKSFSILQIILIKPTMSKEDTNNQPANPYLINSYGKTTSRLNKNWLTNQTPKATDTSAQKSSKDQAQKVQTTKDIYQNLMPKKISELSPSVIFQDADGQQSKNVQPQPRKGPNSSRSGQEKPPQSAPLGLISNAFLGTTTKYQKMDLQVKISTPNKNQEEEDLSPSYKKSQTASQASTNKFARKREIRQSEPKIEALNLKDQAEAASQTHTDRSNLEGKRIERKQDRGKLLKTMNKKDTNGSERLSEHEGSTFGNPGESKLTNETMTHVVEPSELVDPFSTAASKAYKPIQRQNPSRSRIVSETSTIQASRRQVSENVVTNQSTINFETSQSQTPPQSQIKIVKPQSIQRKPYNRTQQQPRKLAEATSIQSEQPQVLPAMKPRGSLSRVPELKTAQTKPEQVDSNQKEEESSPYQYKTNSPSNKPETSDPDHSQAATQRKSLRRSGVIGYIMKRLLNRQMARTFRCLTEFSIQDKVHKVNECNILMAASQQILKAKERNLTMVGFDQLRRKVAASCLQQTKIKATKQQANPVNAACRLLQIVVITKVRYYFKCLAQKKGIINKLKSLIVLDKFLKTKERFMIKSGLLQLQQRAKQRMSILSHANNIMSTFYSQHKSHFFNTLNIYKLCAEVKTQPVRKQPTRSFATTRPALSSQTQIQTASSALIQKEEKLKALNYSIAQNLTILEADVTNAKKQRDQLSSQFQTKIDILRQRNQQFQSQVTSKRNQNQKISKQLLRQPSKAPDHQMQEALQPEETKLQAITNIYISNYKNQQQTIRTQDIINDFAIELDGGSLVKEWDLVFKNSELKRIIASYEDNQAEVSKARLVVMEEQQMVLKLLRSYTKEQYFWQWLHLSVESL